MTPQNFDLIVLGGGPAGYTAAIKGALAGFRVALVEKDKVGGACINRGCIPTKALWGTALSIQRLKDLKEHGIAVNVDNMTFDFGVAAKRQFDIMERMVRNIRARMGRLGVTTFAANGYISKYDPKGDCNRFTVSLSGPLSKMDPIQSKFVLIATGSRPAESEVLFADHHQIVNTDDIVLFEKLPKSIAIVGGGVVACEFASILNKFGVKTALLEHSSQVLSAMDQEVVGMLMQYLTDDGIDLNLSTKVKAVARGPKSVTLTLETDGATRTLEVECVLLAIGRRANSEGLGLDSLGVQLAPRGQIVVDNCCETACKGLYAAGDVIGGQMLAHKAAYDAQIALRSMAGEECHTNYDTVPGAIFTIPEMAAVGLQPDQARQKGISVAIGKFPYSENAQAMCVGKTRGLVKASIDRKTGKVVGCTIVGHDAGNLISEVALAMAAGLSAHDVMHTIHPHPTLSEMVWEAFLDTEGLSVHKNLG